jgi:hypothetical protein
MVFLALISLSSSSDLIFVTIDFFLPFRWVLMGALNESLDSGQFRI